MPARYEYCHFILSHPKQSNLNLNLYGCEDKHCKNHGAMMPDNHHHCFLCGNLLTVYPYSNKVTHDIDSVPAFDKEQPPFVKVHDSEFGAVWVLNSRESYMVNPIVGLFYTAKTLAGMDRACDRVQVMLKNKHADLFRQLDEASIDYELRYGMVKIPENLQ